MKFIDFNLQEPHKTHLLQGKKTIECRLHKGKFEQANEGDICILHNGEQFKIIGKYLFPTFQELFESLGYEKIVPHATSKEEGVVMCYRFYTPDEEKQYGVVGIELERIEGK